MIDRLILSVLLTTALCHAAKPELRWTYEEMRKDFESRTTVEEKLEAIWLLDIQYVSVIIREQVAEADRIKLVRIFIEDEDLSVRTRAAWAIGYNGWGAAFSEELIAMLAADPPKETIISVARAMGTSDHEAFSPHLVQLLEHPDPAVQLEVARYLRLLDAEAAHAFLESWITDPEREMSQRVAALGKLGMGPAAVAMVRKQAQAPEPELRRKAAESLGLRHGTGQGDLLAELLNDKDARVRGLAAKGLGGLSDHTAAHEDAIAKLLEDPDPFVRHSAADALRVAKAVRFLPQIKKLRNDPDERVQRRARICVDLMTRPDEKG